VLIAQITDIHIGFERGDPDEHNMQRLRAVMARLRDGPNRPDALLLTGDLTERGDAKSYARLADAVAVCPCPVWPMVGNHDAREALLEAFPNVTGADGFVHYARDFGAVRVIVLDTLEPGRHGGAFCEARAAWLADELAAHPDRPTLLAMHHPPFSSGIEWIDADEDQPWIARFAGAIARHRQVVGIVAGHLHRTIVTGWNGIPLTVCPSTAPAVALDLTPVDPQAPDGRPMIADEPPAYALHRWDGRRLVTHFETAGENPVLARWDEGWDVVRKIAAERRS
jgi:3',5'-cyclic-AMP phosphodiesterase